MPTQTLGGAAARRRAQDTTWGHTCGSWSRSAPPGCTTSDVEERTTRSMCPILDDLLLNALQCPARYRRAPNGNFVPSNAMSPNGTQGGGAGEGLSLQTLLIAACASAAA